jgi:hypothetical protein
VLSVGERGDQGEEEIEMDVMKSFLLSSLTTQRILGLSAAKRGKHRARRGGAFSHKDSQLGLEF